MKSLRIIIFSVLAVLGLGLALAAIPPAQDKPAARSRPKASIRIDIDDLVRDIERAFEALDSIDGLRVRIRGPRRFSLDVDVRGLVELANDLANLGDRLERHYGGHDRDSGRGARRRLTADERRQLRHALRKLRALDIDIDLN
jgi:hypothetical protein